MNLLKSLLLLSVLFLSSCIWGPESICHGTLCGQIENINPDEPIYLSYPIKREGVWRKHIDTITHNNGRFSVDVQVKDIVPASLFFENMDEVELYLEPNKMHFKAHRDSLYNYMLDGVSFEIELENYHSQIRTYTKKLHNANRKLQLINQELITSQMNHSGNEGQLTTRLYELVNEIHTLQQQWLQMAIEFVVTNNDFTITPHIIGRIAHCGGNPNLVCKLYNELSQKQKQSTLGEMACIYIAINSSGPDIGSMAYNFDLEEYGGKNLCLSDYYNNNYVLLDFWASWCRPCLHSWEKIKNLHKKYIDTLQVIGVSIDDDKNIWRSSVREHQLDIFPQVIIDRPIDTDDYYFWEQCDMSGIYRIEQIPCYILINNSGEIVGRWSQLSEEMLRDIEMRVKNI